VQPQQDPADDLRGERVARAKQPNASTPWWVRGTRGAPREEPRRPRRQSARSVCRVSPTPSDQTRAHYVGHEERAGLPGSSRHNDIAATCAICASCVTRVERLNASTSWQARRMRRPPREQPPQRHRGDLHVVRRPRRATSASCIARAERPAHRVSPAPSNQHVVRRPHRATKRKHSRHDAGTELLLLSLYCSLLSTCSTFCMYYR
jgi:hypothetical protein